MIKKALVLLLFLLPFTISAQQAVGSWYIYPLYNGVPTQVVDTPDMTYYLSLGRLYSYDKANDETRDYSETLSDVNITVIDYNAFDKFLFIGYSNGNIDLLYDDGRLVNLPDIKEAQLTYDRGINQVDFYFSNIYVATKFGLVVFDARKGTVTQSGIYGQDVKAVGAHGGYIVINIDHHNYMIPREGMISRFDNFKLVNDDQYNVLEMKGVGEYLVIRSQSTIKPVKYNYNYDDLSKAQAFISPAVGANSTPLMRGADGVIRTFQSNNLYSFDKSGAQTKENSLPTTLRNGSYGTWNGPKELWAANADGLGCYDITSSTPVVKHDRMLPTGAVSLQNVSFVKGAADGSRIYIAPVATSSVYPTKIATNVNSIINVVYPDGNVEDATPSINLTTEAGAKMNGINNIGNFEVDPFNPEHIIVSAAGNGLFVIENKAQFARFHSKNSPLVSYGGATRSSGANFDNEGNLWTAVMVGASDDNAVKILPAAKWKGDLSAVSSSDWVTIKTPGFKAHTDTKFAFVPGTGIVYGIHALWGGKMLCYDTNKTLTNTADDKCNIIDKYKDQDGREFNYAVATEIVCDKKGVIWVGTNAGVYSITNPASGLTGDFRINRIKVPRNDGTNFADYLLDGEFITGIAVDGSNNKWIGTSSSGLYYVSENGDEILGHFTADNSPLPDNAIGGLYCDPNSNEVYVGTNFGLFRYSGFYSPGQADYSNVYAYPNPVKPGYSGWITVTGLMDDSLVKVADASGAVIYQGRSKGGMFTWDGCNAAGARVKSGVYYVFASQNASGSSSGAVTKILIMN